MKGRCHECRWYEAETFRKGECRGAPPTVVWSDKDGIITTFPTVGDDDWCRAWEIKPEIMRRKLKEEEGELP